MVPENTVVVDVFLNKSRSRYHLPKGSFTYYVISRGGGVSKCLRLITGGGGGLVVDYVIKIFIFYQFS